jgi:hypothetical protein
MEKSAKTIITCLLVAGILQIVMGLSHFLMPRFIYQSPGFQYLNQLETDLVTLCILSVGILLIAVGSILVVCAKKYATHKEIVFYILIINLILWFVRIILELLLPIKLPVLFVENPTIYALPAFIILWFIMAYAFVLMRREKHHNR